MSRKVKGFVGRIVCKAPHFKSFSGPPRNRKQQLEITQDQLRIICERIKGKPIMIEHEPNTEVGTITGASLNPDGDCIISFYLHESDPGRKALELVKNKLLTGLSMTHEYYSLKPTEVSLCFEGARENTGVLQEVEIDENQLNLNNYMSSHPPQCLIRASAYFDNFHPCQIYIDQNPIEIVCASNLNNPFSAMQQQQQQQNQVMLNNNNNNINNKQQQPPNTFPPGGNMFQGQQQPPNTFPPGGNMFQGQQQAQQQQQQQQQQQPSMFSPFAPSVEQPGGGRVFDTNNGLVQYTPAPVASNVAFTSSNMPHLYPGGIDPNNRLFGNATHQQGQGQGQPFQSTSVDSFMQNLTPQQKQELFAKLQNSQMYNTQQNVVNNQMTLTSASSMQDVNQTQAQQSANQVGNAEHFDPSALLNHSNETGNGGETVKHMSDEDLKSVLINFVMKPGAASQAEKIQIFNLIRGLTSRIHKLQENKENLTSDQLDQRKKQADYFVEKMSPLMAIYDKQRDEKMKQLKEAAYTVSASAGADKMFQILNDTFTVASVVSDIKEKKGDSQSSTDKLLQQNSTNTSSASNGSISFDQFFQTLSELSSLAKDTNLTNQTNSNMFPTTNQAPNLNNAPGMQYYNFNAGSNPNYGQQQPQLMPQAMNNQPMVYNGVPVVNHQQQQQQQQQQHIPLPMQQIQQQQQAHQPVIAASVQQQSQQYYPNPGFAQQMLSSQHQPNMHYTNDHSLMIEASKSKDYGWKPASEPSKETITVEGKEVEIHSINSYKLPDDFKRKLFNMDS